MKFKTEEIEALVKQRKEAAATSSEPDDVLLSEVELGQSDTGTSGTVIAPSWGEPAAADSDLQLADSDLTLAKDSAAPAPAKKKGGSDPKAAKPQELDLSADEELSLRQDSAIAR